MPKKSVLEKGYGDFRKFLASLCEVMSTMYGKEAVGLWVYVLGARALYIGLRHAD